MLKPVALISAFASVLALSACDRPTTVVTNPPPGSTTSEPAPAPSTIVQQVPVPVPVPGPPGPQGEPGKVGAPGDTRVVVVPPAASEPK
jgi:hypothetical protein